MHQSGERVYITYVLVGNKIIPNDIDEQKHEGGDPHIL